MFRQSIQYLSESRPVRKLVTETAISRRLVERFVAGETLDDAIAKARILNESGLSVSLDYLGEAVATREEAMAARDAAIASIERMVLEEIAGNVSLKPSQLGLAIESGFCVDNVDRILEVARRVGDGEGEIFIRLDMEASPYTEATIQLVEALWGRGYRNVGTVVQSSLHRTIDDVRRLNELGSRVRLVKGAYKEPASAAFQDKEEVDRRFIRAMKLLLVEGHFPAFATHDEAMIDATRRYAFEHGIPRDSFEFQMLYGVRRDLQHRLWEEGYKIRVYVPYGESWYPYLMRRLAERPANLFFLGGSLVRESPVGRFAKPLVVGAEVLAGVFAGRVLRGRSR